MDTLELDILLGWLEGIRRRDPQLVEVETAGRLLALAEDAYTEAERNRLLTRASYFLDLAAHRAGARRGEDLEALARAISDAARAA